MRKGFLQPHGRRRGGVYRGGGDAQIPGKDFGPVRRRLTGGPSECWEVTLCLESDGKAAKAGWGRAAGVHNVLSVGGPGSITFWVRDLGLVVGDAPKAGGGTCRIPKSDNGAEFRAAEGLDLENCVSIEGS